APKRSGRRQAAAKRVIRAIEATDGGAPLQLLEGRYGPYVTDGETNASVPTGMDPATLSLEDARALLETKRGAASARPSGRRTGGEGGRRAAVSKKVPAGVGAAVGVAGNHKRRAGRKTASS